VARPDGSTDTSSDVSLEQRSFSSLLANLDCGAFEAELAEKVRDAVAAIHDAAAARGGKPKATMTIKLEFKLDSDVVEVRKDVSMSLPKVERGKSIMWATPNNNLSPRNPRQAELGLRVVEQPSVRTVRDDVPMARTV
jgi:hypothetical protein